jgi:type VI secretion system VasD/TssJ family lipoprotein
MRRFAVKSCPMIRPNDRRLRRSFFSDEVRRVAIGLTALSALFLMLGCSSTDPKKVALAEMKWNLAPRDVQISFRASRELNLHDGSPHTILLAVVQSADANSFLAQLASPASIGHLLETGQTGAPTLTFNRFVVSPGQSDTLSLDRAQNAQYVGIVAGYYNLTPPNVSRLFVVPVVMETHGWISKSYTASPQPLVVNLALGPKQITEAQRVDPKIKGGNLVTAPGEQTGMIPISPGGISEAHATIIPPVIALPQ